MPEISITITAPVDKVDEFVEGFLECRPVPVDEEGHPLYTVKEHIKRELIQAGSRIAEEGNRRLHARTRVPTKNALI